MNDSPRFRRRVSSGMRKVVTFVAKRVAAPRSSRGLSGVQSLLQTPVAANPPSRFRKWLPVALAAFMTILTGLVLWSVFVQLPTVFADTKAVARQIEKLEEQIHAKLASPEDQEANEEEITSLHTQEDKAQQERTRLNDKVAKLQSDLEEVQKREQVLRDTKQVEEQALETHRERLKDLLNQNLDIHPGPPVHYDAGPEPKAPWCGEIAGYYLFSREYYSKWNAWRKAKAACDAFNAFQDMTGVEFIELQGRAESIKKQVAAFNQKLEAVNARLTSLGLQLRHYTDAPATAWDDLNALRKRMANTAFVRTIFWALDIPTLLSCLATTAVAYSRMFLISGRFARRQLVRCRA